MLMGIQTLIRMTFLMIALVCMGILVSEGTLKIFTQKSSKEKKHKFDFKKPKHQKNKCLSFSPQTSLFGLVDTKPIRF